VNPMRLSTRLLRRLRQGLPPGLAAAVLRVEQGAGWSASPLAALGLGTAPRHGCLCLQLDATLAERIRQRGAAGLPALDGAGRWQALGRRGLRFRAVLRERQVVVCDAVHRRLWLLWREPGTARCARGY